MYSDYDILSEIEAMVSGAIYYDNEEYIDSLNAAIKLLEEKYSYMNDDE
jgi:hypothetical protein